MFTLHTFITHIYVYLLELKLREMMIIKELLMKTTNVHTISYYFASFDTYKEFNNLHAYEVLV